jgi:hypothetical protein
LSSCNEGPKVRVNVSNPSAGGMDYYDEALEQSGFTPYEATNKYICFTPTDLQTLLNYCGSK